MSGKLLRNKMLQSLGLCNELLLPAPQALTVLFKLKPATLVQHALQPPCATTAVEDYRSFIVLTKASLCNVDLLVVFPGYRSDVFIWSINMQSILFPEDAYQASLRRRIAYLGYAIIIIIGTIPGARADVGEVASGFFLHFTTYAFMTMLLFTGYQGSAGSRALRAVAIVAAMGAIDEFIQSFLPYRNGTIRDWYVDVAAAVVASVILAQLFLKARRNSPAATKSANGRNAHS